MKKLLFLLLAFTLLSACRDKDQDENVLPEATHSGKNTGGALVDGKVWVAKIETPNSLPGGNNTIYSHDGSNFNFEITLNQYNNESSVIKLYISDTEDITTKTYSVSTSANLAGYYSDANHTLYDMATSGNGFVSITKFDKTSQIISGTFSFKAVNSSGQIINITEGRFDKKFLQ